MAPPAKPCSPRAQAPITIRHGHTIIHVNESECFPSVMANLKDPMSQQTPPYSRADDELSMWLLSTSQLLTDLFATHHDKHFANLRDAMFASRHLLSNGLCKRLTAINAAASLSRHKSARLREDILHQVKEQLGQAADAASGPQPRAPCCKWVTPCYLTACRVSRIVFTLAGCRPGHWCKPSCHV